MERSLAEPSVCFMSSVLVTGRVRRLIRHAAYTARHTLCMAVSYVAGLPALKSVISVPNRHTDLVCFSVCTLVRVLALFEWAYLRWLVWDTYCVVK